MLKPDAASSSHSIYVLFEAPVEEAESFDPDVHANTARVRVVVALGCSTQGSLFSASHTPRPSFFSVFSELRAVEFSRARTMGRMFGSVVLRMAAFVDRN